MPEGGDFEARRQLVQMQMLYEVGLALSESLDPTHVAQEILQRALAMVDARAGALLVPRAGPGDLEAVAQVGLGHAEQDLLQLPGIGQAWSSGQAVPADLDSPIGRHLLILPLRSGKRVCGLLLVFDKEQRDGGVTRFDEADRELLDSFALQAGSALHNAHLHRDLHVAYSALQAAQEKIAQLQQLRALGDLSAHLAHALRHVLGLVVGHADGFLTLSGDPARAMEAILTAAEGGQSLIERISRATRLGVGRDRTRVSLNEVIEAAVSDARILVANRKTQVEWVQQLSPDLPETYLNVTDGQEAILNLIVNGVEAMPAGGRLTVASRGEGDRLAVAVTDTGTGIADEARERLFEPFYTTKDDVGSGLGLSIVYRIVEDHGGRIEVASAVGQGSTFTLLFPILAQPPAAAAEPDAPEDLDP